MKSKASPPVHDTPRKVNYTVADDYRSGELTSARAAVARDLDLVPVVSTQYFLDTVIPRISPDIFKTVIEAFQKAGGITFGILTDVAEEPAKSGKTELEAFRCLDTCFNNVVKAFKQVYPDATPRLKMSYQPNKIPFSNRTNKTRPDGTLVLSDTTGGWMDIILAMEEKLKDNEKDKHDDFLKVIWSGHHILRNDPRRQFAFGITIENVSARFWYFSRSHAMVTQDFNFREDYEPLIQLFTCLTFCDDLNLNPPRISPLGPPQLYSPASASDISKARMTKNDEGTEISGTMAAGDSDSHNHMEMLGYDSTIKEIVDGQGCQQFRILVDGTWYITKAILSDFKADIVRGRATRVWEVYEDGTDGSVTYALKDVWLDSDCQMEGELLNTIRRKIDDDAFFSSHFLTIIKDWHVEDSNHEPVMTSMFMRGRDIQFSDIERWLGNVAALPIKTTVAPTNNISMRTISLGVIPRLFAPDREPTPEDIARMFRARKHCRTIFKEVGIPYHDLRHMPDMMSALCEVTEALERLWRARYVHRDISTGNILWYKGHARLSDLEFVKCWDDSSMHEVKVGTAQFMAVEVCDGIYIFRPTDLPNADTVDALYELVPEDRHEETQRIKPIFKHNPIHDLESMWWIAVWTLFYFFPENLTTTQENINAQARTYALLFPGPSGSTSLRKTAFQNISYSQELMERLPTPFWRISSLLQQVHRKLLDYYTNVEIVLPTSIDFTAFTGIHQVIHLIFTVLRNVVNNLKIHGVVVLDSKRRRTDSIDNGGNRTSKKPRHGTSD